MRDFFYDKTITQNDLNIETGLFLYYIMSRKMQEKVKNLKSITREQLDKT